MSRSASEDASVSPKPFFFSPSKLTHRVRRGLRALLLAHVAVARQASVVQGAQGLPVPRVAPAREDEVVGALRHEKGRAGDDVGAGAGGGRRGDEGRRCRCGEQEALAWAAASAASRANHGVLCGFYLFFPPPEEEEEEEERRQLEQKKGRVSVFFSQSVLHFFFTPFL